MVTVNPYRRWRRAFYYATAAVVCVLTLAALLLLVSVLIDLLHSFTK
ncbi:hypothetical protein ACWT_8077 [Actinoplanes sp. SE50]|nr:MULTISPECIES: hypothetical protein [unclassified Actinoplanes]AEV89086.1 hypothetical protein ACPL_8208 [Actinoplanes sp. SE50/110]ATO87492.1 hypothetical protein ACWT_8077 [Actinoplanes sp. SE50]SLM04910.1 hypothetical protein ACSP50_8222 [Actinoplanes sp. SE50/110]